MTYFVVRVPKRGTPFSVPWDETSPHRPGRATIFMQDEIHVVEMPFEDNHCVFQCNNEPDAKALALALAKQHSGVNFVVCEAKQLCTSHPAAPTWSAYSEKGLMPL